MVLLQLQFGTFQNNTSSNSVAEAYYRSTSNERNKLYYFHKTVQFVIKVVHVHCRNLESRDRHTEVSVCLQRGRPGFDPWVGKISWRRKWQPTPVFLPGKSHGRRNLVGYSPWGRKELDTTERLTLPYPVYSSTIQRFQHSYFG